jgi:hypothetical protein
MDRAIVYDAQLPQTTDILNTNMFFMKGLSFALRAMLGDNAAVHGLTCTPTGPATLNVLLGIGEIYQLDPVDATAYGDLGTDSAHTILKQGLLQDPVTLAITPPGTPGFSQIYLVQVILQDIDTGLAVLPYYNAANPSQPFSGPNNSGSSNFSIRQCACTVGLKAGVAAATGSQVAPTPDAGWVGLYTILVANGQTQITSGGITLLLTAPFFPALPAIPFDVQKNLWTYCVDTSIGGPATATTATTLSSSAVLTFTGTVPAWVVAGMKAYDLTTPTAITGGQTVLSVGANTITLNGNVNATVGLGDLIAFSTNGMVANVFPQPLALTPGMSVLVKCAATNSGNTTFNLNGLGAVAVHRANGANVAPGDIQVGEVLALVYDGAAWQTLNFEGFTSTTTNNNTFVLTTPYAADSGIVNAMIGLFSPAITSLSAGNYVLVKVAVTNTGPTTLQCNAMAPVAILENQVALLPRALIAGEMVLLMYDGTSFQKAPTRNIQISFDSGTPPASNIFLAVGDNLVITFNNVFSVPFKVATVPGIYDVEILIRSTSTNCYHKFHHKPNDNDYGQHFRRWHHMDGDRNTPGPPYHDDRTWGFSEGHDGFVHEHFDGGHQGGDDELLHPPFMLHMVISTFPECKHIRFYGGCKGGTSHGHHSWDDVVTNWTSLGTFECAQTFQEHEPFSPEGRITGIASVWRRA